MIGSLGVIGIVLMRSTDPNKGNEYLKNHRKLYLTNNINLKLWQHSKVVCSLN